MRKKKKIDLPTAQNYSSNAQNASTAAKICDDTILYVIKSVMYSVKHYIVHCHSKGGSEQREKKKYHGQQFPDQ